ncbi:MAG: co-chaperone GroES, partial [Caulobacteraceae bacterium]|nr:co-chaperone GroES [Caulobacteraceae bacterium]
MRVDEREKSKVLAVVMEEKPNTGEIVAVGPGQYDHKGRFISMP